jgi:hypothetical protein
MMPPAGAAWETKTRRPSMRTRSDAHFDGALPVLAQVAWACVDRFFGLRSCSIWRLLFALWNRYGRIGVDRFLTRRRLKICRSFHLARSAVGLAAHLAARNLEDTVAGIFTECFS